MPSNFKFQIRFLFAIPLLCLALSGTATTCAAKTPQIAAVHAGFAGYYKVGALTPLQVTVRGGLNDLTARARIVADSDGLNCAFESEPSNLPAGQETMIPLYVRFGHESSSLDVELLGGDMPFGTRTFAAGPAPSPIQNALRPGQRLIVSVGAGEHGMDDALPSSQGKTARDVVAAVDSIADLPSRWQGYDAVDFVILSTDRPESFTNLKANDARIEALDQWVHAGGTLVFAAGEQAEAALSGASPLTRFVPGHYEETLRLGKTSVWETFAKSQNQIPPPELGEKLILPTAKLADVRGQILARAGDVPLVVRSVRGLGQVVFVAADLDRGPIAAWSDRPLLLAALLGLPAIEQPPEASSVDESYGFDDLAGQLRSSLEQFGGVRLVSFFVAATLIVAYVLLIGPGDYFLLRRLRQLRWTWVTFPLVAVLFAAGASWTSLRLKGGAVRINQVDLIDIDSEGTARGATWFSVFSPRAETFDLSLRGRLPNGGVPQEASASLGWLGKAGSGFNGMYGRDAESASPLWSESFTAVPSLDVLSEAPVQVASCKNFVYRWLGRAADQGLKVSLHEENRQPTGTIANNIKRSDGKIIESVPLEHAYLVYDGWAYALGTLRPGEALEVGSSTRRLSLKSFMSRAAFEDVEAAGQAEKTPYDPSSRDAAYILRAMLFFDMAEARKYTGLANDYQGFIDLSRLLRTGRAVIVAMPPQDDSHRGADLLRGPVPPDGEADERQPLVDPLARHTIIYRFVVPVEKQ